MIYSISCNCDFLNFSVDWAMGFLCCRSAFQVILPF